MGLLEVIFGILWPWLFVHEVPSGPVLLGGSVVILALVVNELLGWQSRAGASRIHTLAAAAPPVVIPAGARAVMRSTTSGPVPKQRWTNSWRTLAARSMPDRVERTQSRIGFVIGRTIFDQTFRSGSRILFGQLAPLAH